MLDIRHRTARVLPPKEEVSVTLFRKRTGGMRCREVLHLKSPWHVACLAALGKVMINGLFTQSNYQGLKKMLDATIMRHEAIASNLANLETPNYKRIDVESSFGEELGRAIAARNVKDISRVEPRIVLDKSAVSPNRDGNTVQLEKELLVLQQNSLAHTMQTQFISGSLSKLRSAIQGRNA